MSEEATEARIERWGLFLKDRLVPVLFVLSFVWALSQAVLGSVGSSPLAVVIFLALMALIAFLWLKKRSSFRRCLRLVASPKFLVPLFVIYAVLLVATAQLLSTSIVDGTWDFPYLGRDAYALANGEGLVDSRRICYARYANNQLLLLLVSVLFKFASFVHPHIGINACHHIAIGLNSLVLILSIGLLYFIAEKTRGPEAGAVAVLLSMAFAPFWAYSSIYYSDIFPIPLMLGEILLFLGLDSRSSGGNFLRMLAIGVLAGVAFQLKATTIFVTVALVFAWALTRNLGRGWGRICLPLGSFVIALLVYISIGHFAQFALGVNDDLKDEYQFPYTHWVMMSLGETGGYDSESVRLTEGAGDKAEKQKANLEEIEKRLSDMGLVGSLGHVFVTKVQRTWGDGCLDSENYVNRCPDYPSSFPYALFSWDGNFHAPVALFAQVLWLALLLILVVSGIRGLKPRRNRSGMVKVSFICEQNVIFIAKAALLLFFLFELIWECNSRYVLHLIPLAILICSFELCSWISDERVEACQAPQSSISPRSR